MLEWSRANGGKCCLLWFGGGGTPLGLRIGKMCQLVYLNVYQLSVEVMRNGLILAEKIKFRSNIKRSTLLQPPVIHSQIKKRVFWKLLIKYLALSRYSEKVSVYMCIKGIKLPSVFSVILHRKRKKKIHGNHLLFYMIWKFTQENSYHL